MQLKNNGDYNTKIFNNLQNKLHQPLIIRGLLLTIGIPLRKREENPSIVMIRQIVDDSKGTIELFHHKNANHLVGKRHF